MKPRDTYIFDDSKHAEHREERRLPKGQKYYEMVSVKLHGRALGTLTYCFDCKQLQKGFLGFEDLCDRHVQLDQAVHGYCHR